MITMLEPVRSLGPKDSALVEEFTNRVVIIERYPIVAWALRKLLCNEEGLEVSGDARDMVSGLELIRQQRPNLVVVDLVLCGHLVFDFIRDLLVEVPDINIIVYSGMDGSLYVEQCLKLGAKGYVSRSRPIDEIVAALRSVAGGGIYVDQNCLASLLAKRATNGKYSVGEQIKRLSPSEMKVFHLIGQGASSSEIAVSLHRSINTIETYRTRIKNKLGLKDASKLSYFAFQHSLFVQGVDYSAE
jgi:DNA-binding NarL/FixJ family response regulator